MFTPRPQPLILLAIAAILAINLTGCKGMPIDPSMSSVEAGDYTLGASACGAVPGEGMDVCRVTEGTRIDSDWVLIVPARFSRIISGEINIFYRDVQRTYAITDRVVRIPWRDFFKADMWSRDFDGEALALVSISYKDNQGIIQVQEFRGIAKLVVTRAGYSRLPIDSGYAAWKTNCKIQYSTAGRSAISCR